MPTPNYAAMIQQIMAQINKKPKAPINPFTGQQFKSADEMRKAQALSKTPQGMQFLQQYKAKQQATPQAQNPMSPGGLPSIASGAVKSNPGALANMSNTPAGVWKPGQQTNINNATGLGNGYKDGFGNPVYTSSAQQDPDDPALHWFKPGDLGYATRDEMYAARAPYMYAREQQRQLRDYGYNAANPYTTVENDPNRGY